VNIQALIAPLVTAGLMAVSVSAFADAVAPKGDAAAGQTKNSMCIGCHGIASYRTAFPSVYSVPMIAGQSEGYIVSALKAYRSGDRSHPSMRGIAGSLSDQDIADLAAYYSAGKAK
jgi:cytochrome c553